MNNCWYVYSVSTTRPLVLPAEPISDNDLEAFLKKLNLTSRRRVPRAQCNSKLLELQLAVTKFYFTAANVWSIVDCFSEDDATRARVIVCLFCRIDDLFNFDFILRRLNYVCCQDVILRLGVLNALNPLKPSVDYTLNMKHIDNRKVLFYVLELASQETGDQLIEHPKSQISIMALYAGLGRLIENENDLVANFTFCEIGERQSYPTWNLRQNLMKNFLLGTYPMDNRMNQIVTMYKEMETAGSLTAGPVDLQYREHLKQIAHKKMAKMNSRQGSKVTTALVVEKVELSDSLISAGKPYLSSSNSVVSAATEDSDSAF